MENTHGCYLPTELQAGTALQRPACCGSCTCVPLPKHRRSPKCLFTFQGNSVSVLSDLLMPSKVTGFLKCLLRHRSEQRGDACGCGTSRTATSSLISRSFLQRAGQAARTVRISEHSTALTHKAHLLKAVCPDVGAETTTRCRSNQE